jgi:hypothetical protein
MAEEGFGKLDGWGRKMSLDWQTDSKALEGRFIGSRGQ